MRAALGDVAEKRLGRGSMEIEAKFAVPTFDAVRAALHAAGATHVGRVLETNRFFDRPDGSLRQSGCGLRVRALQTLDGPARGSSITFKGPLAPGPLKARPEYEVQVDDAGSAAALLAQLGFVEFFAFEKRRESWRLGACEIELDELPHLGCYVEIEGPSTERIEESRRLLSLETVDNIRASYLGLLVRHCQTAGITSRHITFSS